MKLLIKSATAGILTGLLILLGVLNVISWTVLSIVIVFSTMLVGLFSCCKCCKREKQRDPYDTDLTLGI